MGIAHLLAYALILTVSAGAAIIVYLLRREDKYRDQIVEMVKLVATSQGSAEDANALHTKLTEHIALSNKLFTDFGEIVRDLREMAFNLRDFLRDRR